jgi:peroxiredoxin
MSMSASKTPRAPTVVALDFVGLLELKLAGTDGEYHSVSSLEGRTATVVIFLANGCPTARAYSERLRSLQSSREADGVRIVAINANNPHLSPADTLRGMVKHAADQKLNFPYLKDENGALSRGFGAVCTPHAFVLDKEMKIVYRGRIDDSRLGDRVSSRELDNAISDVVAGKPVAVSQTDPFGCSIVW